MSSTTSPMPSASSYYDGQAISASAMLAWKFYAFGMLAIFVAGILGTVIYLGCFRLKKPAAARGDIETHGTATNEPKLPEGCDGTTSASIFTLFSSSTTLISTPPKAHTATRGGECPCEARRVDTRSYYSAPVPDYISRGTLSYGRQ